MEKIISHSNADTTELARQIAMTLRGGEIITLTGELGAGKTAFSKALATALGVDGLVNSPTFAIMKVHKIVDLSRPFLSHFLHIDAYRLKSWSEFQDLGTDEYLARKDTITVIEWPSQVNFPPQKASLKIHIEVLAENKREFTIEKNA